MGLTILVVVALIALHTPILTPCNNTACIILGLSANK